MGKRLIGLTGGIGAGKSVVSRILRLKGFPVYDCDSEARRLMEENPEIKLRLCERFGQSVYGPSGLCRPRLAELVFSDQESLDWLNSLVHAAVRRDICRWMQDDADSDVMFVESAIMRVSGLDRMCEEIWIVDAPEELRIARAIKRSGMTERQVRARIDAQRSELEFAPGVKLRIIDNSGKCSVLEQIEL